MTRHPATVAHHASRGGWFGWLLLALLAVWAVLYLGAPVYRRRFPALWWFGIGLPAVLWRVLVRWPETMAGCHLAASRKPALTVLANLVGRGSKPPRPRVPRRRMLHPTRNGFWLLVRLLPGQVPSDFADAAPALAHAWRVHGVRVTTPAEGLVKLTATALDPLAEPHLPQPGHGAGELLRVVVGALESGGAWVLDLRRIPHWLIVGATRSGKSTLINALVAGLAPQAVALVGIDCKGGMELSLYGPRLSALATDRRQAVKLLAALVELTQERMALCRSRAVRNVWALPDGTRPVPVVVIVDEIAELFLIASRAEKEEAQGAATALIRLAQLGAALGVFLVVAGQRVGSDLGPGVTALRAQLGGRVCHRVADPETAAMTLGDLHPDALEAAQAIDPTQPGTAVLASGDGWERARSALVAEDAAQRIAERFAHLTPDLPLDLEAESVYDTPPASAKGLIPRQRRAADDHQPTD
ncbi:FtsK/SpoIIIE domain-containing protein [Phaeacidiphilus oryzae]|uniref:FtsK/SpoIIIE domain-containing protein n=1 Tax=Phaeacidiphilus oryzae TaxID=348818 RepID=UPI0009FD00CE